MKRLAIALAVIVAAVALYKLSYPTYTYRYRMTVKVEVDGQVRSGSSVIEVNVSKQPMFLPGVNQFALSDRGEAVFVDLGAGRNIVALLASGPFAERYGAPLGLVPSHFNLDFFNERHLALLPALRENWELAGQDIPTLVTFSNPSVPGTLRLIRAEQLELIFGPGVQWRGISIEMTTDAVTHSIESKLPWVTKMGQTTTIHPGKFTINGTYFKRI